MVEKLGPISFGKGDDLIFLGKDLITNKDYSEEIAAKNDVEIENFINNAYKKAEQIIKSNRKALKAIADVLIKKEVLEHDEFYKIVKPFKLKLIKA